MAGKRHSNEAVLRLLRKIEVNLHGGMDVVSACRKAGVSDKAEDDDEALRLAMIRLAKKYGRYGYRKITELLRVEGWRVNHKKVERLRREEGLQKSPSQPL